jgi:hypothetical protein
MPFVFVSGNLELTVTLTKDDDFLLKEWKDKKLAKQRAEYEKPNLGLWLELENLKNTSTSLPIPIYELDIYEGEFIATQSGNEFNFKFNGKAKASVHKSTKEQTDTGALAKLHSVSINGASYNFDEPKSVDLQISSKKI